jgi:hypothetical protein
MFKTVISEGPKISTVKLVLVWVAILVASVATFEILR